MEPGRREHELSEKLGGWYLQGYEKAGHYFLGDNHKPGHAGITVYTEVSKADWEKLKYYNGLGWKTNIALGMTALFVLIFRQELGLNHRRLPYR